MNFRRYYIPDSAVFIRQVVEEREPVFADLGNVNLLREILRNVKELHPFSIVGDVFLPDHFHLIILPIGGDDFRDVIHSLKTNFTREYKKGLELSSSQSVKFWQKRFWVHVIRDDRDFESYLHYIHFNPVKHGDVIEPREWENSSYVEWEKRGLYPPAFGWDERYRVGRALSHICDVTFLSSSPQLKFTVALIEIQSGSTSHFSRSQAGLALGVSDLQVDILFLFCYTRVVRQLVEFSKAKRTS